MTIKQVWTTSDGVSFATLADAEAWERAHAPVPHPSVDYRIIARPTINVSLTEDQGLSPEELINQLSYTAYRLTSEDSAAPTSDAAPLEATCVSQEIVSCVRRTSPSTGWERVDLDLDALSLSTSLASSSTSSPQDAPSDLTVDIKDINLEQTPDAPPSPSQAPDFMTAFLASHPNAGTQCSDPSDPAYIRLAATVEAALSSRAFTPLCQVSTPALSDYAIRLADPADPAPLHDSASVHFSITPTATPGDPCALDAADLLADAAALVRALQTRFNNVWIRAISGSAALLALPSAGDPAKDSARDSTQAATAIGSTGSASAGVAGELTASAQVATAGTGAQEPHNATPGEPQKAAPAVATAVSTAAQGPHEHKGYAFVQALDVVLAVE